MGNIFWNRLSNFDNNSVFMNFDIQVLPVDENVNHYKFWNNVWILCEILIFGIWLSHFDKR